MASGLEYKEFTGDLVTKIGHQSGTIHRIGRELRAPISVKSVDTAAYTAPSSPGVSSAVAREDHVHGFTEGVWNDLLPLMASGWVNYGGGFFDAQYRVDGVQVSLRGLVRNTGTVASGGVIIIPSFYANSQWLGPQGSVYFAGLCAPGRHMIEIQVYQTSVYIDSAAPANPASFLFLDGLSWRRLD